MGLGFFPGSFFRCSLIGRNSRLNRSASPGQVVSPMVFYFMGL